MTTATIESSLIDFLSSVTGQTDLNGETELQESGVIDSLTMMDLLVFLETEFQVRLDFSDLTPEAFHSPATIARLVASRMTPRNLQAA